MIARGTVRAVNDVAVEAALPPLAHESVVRVCAPDGWRYGTVNASTRDGVSIIVAGPTAGISPGALVEEMLPPAHRPFGTAALGRSLEPADFAFAPAIKLDAPRRAPVVAPLWTGVRAIDALLTIARGARVGIFGVAGAGKSTLIETIVNGADADAVVLGLVGERGREAQRWIARLDERTTAIVATSDRSPSERMAAAEAAFAQAHALARRGLHVLLVLDSLARVAYALREHAVACGEPVGRGGYPASAFAAMAALVERAGAFTTGSITLLATVLADGDGGDPVAEAARSLLDGHIELSTPLAHAGRFPAIDIPRSASRTMTAVAEPRHLRAAATFRRAVTALEEVRELRSVGMAPADPWIRAAIEAEARIEALLRQGPDPAEPAQTLAMLFETADTLGEPHGHHF